LAGSSTAESRREPWHEPPGCLSPKVLADHDALFSASFEGKDVRLDDSDQVRRVMLALTEADISEDEEVRAGWTS